MLGAKYFERCVVDDCNVINAHGVGWWTVIAGCKKARSLLPGLETPDIRGWDHNRKWGHTRRECREGKIFASLVLFV